MTTRWDPESRAGAVAVRTNGKLDLKATKAVSNLVLHWSKYQNLAGEVDVVETSAIRGNYDWRSYLQEETDHARRREERANRGKPQPGPAAPRPPPAPTNLYA